MKRYGLWSKVSKTRETAVTAMGESKNEARVTLWDAVNRFAEAGRGVYGNTSRQRAVADVEREVDRFIQSRVADLERENAELRRIIAEWVNDPEQYADLPSLREAARRERTKIECSEERALAKLERVRKLVEESDPGFHDANGWEILQVDVDEWYSILPPGFGEPEDK